MTIHCLVAVSLQNQPDSARIPKVLSNLNPGLEGHFRILSNQPVMGAFLHRSAGRLPISHRAFLHRSEVHQLRPNHLCQLRRRGRFSWSRNSQQIWQRSLRSSTQQWRLLRSNRSTGSMWHVRFIRMFYSKQPQAVQSTPLAIPVISAK